MINRTTIGIWLCCVLALSIDAQRIHFSDYGEAAIQLSPALTGAYNGSVRVGAKFREQYRGFISQPFTTSQVYVDAPRGMKMAEYHWWGVGLSVTRSDAGDLSLQGIRTGLSLAYHRALDKKFRTVVSVGTQVLHSYLQIKNPDAARFEDQLLSMMGESADQGLLDNYNSNKLSLSTGIAIKKTFNKRINFRSGFSFQKDFAYQISNQSQVLITQIMAFGNWNIKADKKSKVIWKPGFVVQNSLGIFNALAGMGMEHEINKEKSYRLAYTMGYRFKDAAILGVRFTNPLWSASIQYDMTVSSAHNYNGMNGALEFGIARIFIIHPKVKEKVLFVCPRL